jgi:hypothetical protein
MAAPRRNRNAQKWNRKKVLYCLQKINKMAGKGQQLFWGRLLKKVGLYRDVWRYWREHYGHIAAIRHLMQLIETHCEANLLEAGLEQRIHVRLCILCLYNIYGWNRKLWTDPWEKFGEEEMEEETQVVTRQLYRADSEMAWAA